MTRTKLSLVLRWAGLVAFVLLLAYVGSYVILSHRGVVLCKAVGIRGFYFFPPENTDSWRRWNYGCVNFYYPLLAVEMWRGTVEGIGYEPLWRLSGANNGDPMEETPATNTKVQNTVSPPL